MNPLTWQNPEQLFVAQVLKKIFYNSVAELRIIYAKKGFIFIPYTTENRDFINLNNQITLYFLCNDKSFSLYHSVKYKNHSAGYIFHTVKYKYQSVVQRKHRQKRKKM